MKIFIAPGAGFCFGVKRALETAYKELEKMKGIRPVYTLGPLVHNPQVINRLEKDGIRSISEEKLDSIESGHIIIRTHGVAPLVKEKILQKGFTFTDATCPLVERIHKIVLHLKQEGYPVVIVGHGEHPEVEGIVGELKGNCTVISSLKEAEEMKPASRLGIVAQTTFLVPEFLEIGCKLLSKARELKIHNTICDATQERQESALKTASETHVMIIVGGRESSNTRRLVEICQRVNPNCHQVESPEELKREWFYACQERETGNDEEGEKDKQRLKEINNKTDIKVGITAGASTPHDVIEEVINKIKQGL